METSEKKSPSSGMLGSQSFTEYLHSLEVPDEKKEESLVSSSSSVSETVDVMFPTPKPLPSTAVAIPTHPEERSLKHSGAGASSYGERKPLSLSSSENILMPNAIESELSESKDDGIWIHDLVSVLNGWLWDTVAPSKEPTGDLSAEPREELIDIEDEFWDDWEFMLTSVDQLLLNQSQARAAAVKDELSELRDKGNRLRMRPMFVTAARKALESLGDDNRELIEKAALPSFIRSKLLNDLVNDIKLDLLLFAKTTFFGMDVGDGVVAGSPGSFSNFMKSFEEEKYRKGIGEKMSSMSFIASHAAETVGLTPSILSDIMWALWSAMCASVVEEIARDLSHSELSATAESIISCCADKLCESWLDVWKKSKAGLKNAGGAVSNIMKEQKEQEERIAAIKKRGADAKWGQPMTMTESLRSTSTKPINLEKISEIKSFLESNLWFRVARE